MVELLLFGDACAGVPGGRQSRLRSDAKLPRQTAQSRHSWQSSVLSERYVRRNRRAANGTRLLWIATDSFAVKSIGEPDAGNRHVRFDELVAPWKRVELSRLKWRPRQSLASSRVPSLAWRPVTVAAKRRQGGCRPEHQLSL